MGTRPRNGKVWDAPWEREKPRECVPAQLGKHGAYLSRPWLLQTQPTIMRLEHMTQPPDVCQRSPEHFLSIVPLLPYRFVTHADRRGNEDIGDKTHHTHRETQPRRQ